MARPQTASDEEILQAAHRVMLRRGNEGFTLSEVAREVGLTRSAIIQRFESTRALKTTLTETMVSRFQQALSALSVSCSGDGLLVLVTFVAGILPERDQLGAFMHNLQVDIHDAELGTMEKQRGAALHEAISKRMPPVGISHESAVMAFMAHLGGSISQWQVWSDEEAKPFLLERTREWLKLAGIPFSENVPETGNPDGQPINMAI